MRRSAITVGNGVSIFNLDIKLYKQEKARTARNRITTQIARFIELVSVFGAVAISTALISAASFT